MNNQACKLLQKYELRQAFLIKKDSDTNFETELFYFFVSNGIELDNDDIHILRRDMISDYIGEIYIRVKDAEFMLSAKTKPSNNDIVYYIVRTVCKDEE